MNGVEVAKRLKEANPKMNIIFVTGFSEYKGDAMDMEASGYIMKPVTKEDVESELSDLRFPIIPKSNALLRVQQYSIEAFFAAEKVPAQRCCLRCSALPVYLYVRYSVSFLPAVPVQTLKTEETEQFIKKNHCEDLILQWFFSQFRGRRLQSSE